MSTDLQKSSAIDISLSLIDSMILMEFKAGIYPLKLTWKILGNDYEVS